MEAVVADSKHKYEQSRPYQTMLTGPGGGDRETDVMWKHGDNLTIIHISSVLAAAARCGGGGGPH